MGFWREKSLNEMSEQEWESLCDGCGRCCLHKLEDEDTGEIVFTRVACHLLNIATCRCGNYKNRGKLVPDCLSLRDGFTHFHWLPSTCAYRLLAQNDDLPDWHPLISGHPDSIHKAEISVRDFALPETSVDCLEDHVIEGLN